jgi:LmbE family N-acetylglucosaminyl deacetylase
MQLGDEVTPTGGRIIFPHTAGTPNRDEGVCMEWDEIQRAMVVFAHPDDGEFGSAGTVAKLTRDGKAVVYVVTSDGSKGSSDLNVKPEQLIATRQQEQRNAGEVLGLEDVCFLNFPDGMLVPSIELRKAITAAIRRYKPDLVIAQSPIRDLTASIFVQHPDHLATGEATFAAVYPCCRDRLTFPELLAEGLEPHIVRELWVVGTAAADHFVDISTTIEHKVAALMAHASQVGEQQGQMLPERAKQTGEAHGMEYAEAFKRIQLPG